MFTFLIILGLLAVAGAVWTARVMLRDGYCCRPMRSEYNSRVPR